MSLPQKLQIPDFRHYRSGETIRSIKIENFGLRVEWSDGRSDWFYALWLRENSPDESTTHPLSREQILEITELPDQVEIVSVECVQNQMIKVCWKNDSLVSFFDCSWLRYWGDPLILQSLGLPDRTLWTQLGQSRLPYFNLSEIEESSDAKFNWASAIHKLGFGIVRGLRPKSGVLEKFLSSIGPIRSSNFGEVFDVRFEVDPKSNAYTDAALPVHTDLCTREELPGIQWLHCLDQSVKGGLSILSDGFAVADLMKRDYREEYEALVGISVSFINKSKNTDFRFFSPVIKLNHNQDPDEIRLSPWLRGPVSGTQEEIHIFYRALRRFISLSNAQEHSVTIRLEPGDLLAFDNKRLLHGRTQISSVGSRWLRGCYMDRDDLHNIIRMKGKSEF